MDRGPGGAHGRIRAIEPKLKVVTVTSAVVAVIAFGVLAAALLYPTDTWPAQWRFSPEVSARTPPTVAVGAGFIGVAFLIQAAVHGRRWRIARIVQRLSKDPATTSLFPDTNWAPWPRRAATIPHLDVAVCKPRQLQKRRAKLRPVTGASNVIGERPLKIAFLRLFENQPRARTFMEGAWREFGCVYLLRSAESVTPAEYRRAKRSNDLAGLFMSSWEEFLPAVEGGGFYRKGRYKLTAVGPKTIRVRDKYGSYSVEAFLCHGLFWKSAVDLLIDRVDLAGLSGLAP